MFKIHKKKRIIISAFVAAVFILPAVTFAVNRIAASENTFAYEKPENYTYIVDPNLYDCAATWLKIDFPAEEISSDGLTEEQLAKIERLTCGNQGISDTTGLEKMTALYYLDLNRNQITDIDLSHNTALDYLELSRNQIADIDLSNNTVLTSLYLYSNQLTDIDVSYNTALQRLDLYQNQLEAVDLSSNTALRDLMIDNIIIYTEILPTKVGNNYVYDLSGMKYIADGGHGPETVDFSIDNTSYYSYDEANKLLTVNDPVGAGQYVQINGNVANFSYKFLLSTILDYNVNGGTGSYEMQNCYMGIDDDSCTVTISSVAPTRNNYHFLGWATSASATTAAYQPGDDIDLSVSQILYAVWSPIYTLTYNSNGGSTAPAAQTCYGNSSDSGCNITISSDELTKEGYRFLGWADSSSATEAEYSVGGNITLNGDKTIYAVWGLLTTDVSLSFDLNGGQGSVATQTCTISAEQPTCSVTIPNTTPTRNGYNFLGWANSSTATTATYSAGNTINLNDNKTVYAVWELITTTVHLNFNLNGGAGSMAAQTCTTDINHSTCTATIPNTTPTRAGYSFLGWADSSSATEATYSAGNSFNLSSDKTIYAVWDLVITTIGLSFDLNGVEGEIAAQTCEVDINNPTCSFVIPETTLTREGYNYLGWAESATATAATYQSGDTVTISANKTIYVVWEEIKSDDEEPDIPVPDTSAPDTGANMVSDAGAVFTIAVAPAIVTVAYAVIRRHNRKNSWGL